MNWAAQPERGSTWLVRVAMFLVRHGGWTLGRGLAAIVSIWFVVTSRRARKASRDYLGRALGRPARLADIIGHFDSFGRSVLDRAMFLSGLDRDYEITIENLDALVAVLADKRGCVVMGAHLGSFEVLRTLARQAPVPVWALMYRRNAGALTALFDELAPGLRDRILEIGNPASMIRARECIERGEIVGLLADRAPPGQRSLPAPFLGAMAPFPSGPFVLAAMLGAPVFLFYGVRTGKRRYDVRFELFAQRVVLRREARVADLQALVCRYAASVERACRAHPLQWFNFFPFWERDDARSEPARLGASAGAVMAVARKR